MRKMRWEMIKDKCLINEKKYKHPRKKEMMRRVKETNKTRKTESDERAI